MERLTGDRREVVPRMISTGIFVCAAASIAYTFLKVPPSLDALSRVHRAGTVALAGILFFLFASVLVWFKPRVGYSLGVFAGIAALPWFALTELSLGPAMSSWIALNGSEDLFPGQAEFTTLAEFRILSIVLIVVAIACSLLRFLPTRLLLWRRPLYQRTWPAFVVCALILTPWFIRSAIPYRIPIIADGVAPEFRIVHVEKRGLRFHETDASVFQDGKVYVLHNDRRLFQYRFQTQPSLGVMSQMLHERISAVVRSPELSQAHTSPARALHSWNAEIWYVVHGVSQPLAFTSEYQTAPPRNITDLFEEIQKVPSVQERPQAIRDICLGFCYSPVVAPRS